MVGEVVEKKSKWGKVGKVVLVISSLLIAALAVAYFLTGIPAAVSHFRENRTKALKLGLVIDPAAIQQMNQVPDDQNMDSIFAQLPPPDLGYGEEIPAKIQKQWPTIRATLPRLNDALKRTFLSPKLDFNSLYAGESKSRSNAIHWGIELTKVATEAAKDGDFDRTSECLMIAAQIAMVLDDKATSNAMWDRQALAGRIELLIRTLIPKHAREYQWITLFEEVVKTLDKPYEFRKAAIMDHALAINRINLIKRRPEVLNDENGVPELRPMHHIPKFLEANEARIDELYVATFPNLPTDPWNLAAVRKTYQAIEGMYDKGDLSYTLLRYISSTTVGSGASQMAETARRYALLQAITILKENRSPTRGLPLTDRHRLDLDGKPLRLKKLAKGWILYSVGPDESDDGGVDDPRAKNRDFVVHLSPATVPPAIKPKTSSAGRPITSS